MKKFELESEDDVRLLSQDKYIVSSDDEIYRIGFNYRGYEVELNSDDLANLYAKKKIIMFNVDGEYAFILKVKDE